LIIAGA
jgi:uncharacterized protein